jgi:hypothetical protein
LVNGKERIDSYYSSDPKGESMVDRIESRIAQLTGISAHWRRIASGILSTTVNSEIEAFVRQFDDEVERLKSECLGKRTCPCKFDHDCFAIDTDAARSNFYLQAKPRSQQAALALSSDFWRCKTRGSNAN